MDGWVYKLQNTVAVSKIWQRKNNADCAANPFLKSFTSSATQERSLQGGRECVNSTQTYRGGDRLQRRESTYLHTCSWARLLQVFREWVNYGTFGSTENFLLFVYLLIWYVTHHHPPSSASFTSVFVRNKVRTWWEQQKSNTSTPPHPPKLKYWVFWMQFLIGWGRIYIPNCVHHQCWAVVWIF